MVKKEDKITNKRTNGNTFTAEDCILAHIHNTFMDVGILLGRSRGYHSWSEK